MRFRHVLLMELVEGATSEQRQAVISGLRRLPGQVSEIRFWQVGEDAGLLAGEDLDIAIIADFDNEQAYLAYRNHPDHLGLIASVIAPVLKRIERVQFWTDQSERPPTEPAGEATAAAPSMYTVMRDRPTTED